MTNVPENVIERREIHVYVLQHKRNDLMVAISPELRGLVLHGRSSEEIERTLPGAVRDLLEAEGNKIASLTVRRDDRIADAGFGPPPFIADAHLMAGS